CSCQTANCFNKSKGVFITGSKLKALPNLQPSWRFSVHNKKRRESVFFIGRVFIARELLDLRLLLRIKR
ncbi:hypothetical protein, partial [Yersinia entomophaga]|uniref:hypothetical protein n=1 Tax=Yersinia entomophaga TaxID=935293 RepID=UPI0039EF9B39